MDILTPTNEEENPFSQLISWISHYNGCVKVASFNKHPKEICDHKVVVYCRNQSTPGLKKTRGSELYEINDKMDFIKEIVKWINKSCLASQKNDALLLPHCSHGYCGQSAEAKTTWHSSVWR